MTAVGQIEKRTQRRVVKLFRETLGYDYLGDRTDREGNSNIETELLRAWLKKQGVDEALIGRALYVLEKAAGDTSRSLYDRNRAVYELLRYGVKVKAEAGAHNETVWLIDWTHPEKNDFAIAEEVTVSGADAKAPLVAKWEVRLGVKATFAGIKRMKTKWGGCNVDAARIWLNLELCKKPVQCLEYIVVHELMHFVERHHGDRFVNLMDKHLPQWRHHRKVLNDAPLGHADWTY